MLYVCMYVWACGRRRDEDGARCSQMQQERPGHDTWDVSSGLGPTHTLTGWYSPILSSSSACIHIALVREKIL